jgi:hypothetical protein
MRNFNHEMAIQTLRFRSEASTLSRIGERWRVRAARVSVPTPQTAVAIVHSVWSTDYPLATAGNPAK